VDEVRVGDRRDVDLSLSHASPGEADQANADSDCHHS
jgi:hypothetical protein